MPKQTSPNTNKDLLSAIYEQGIVQQITGLTVPVIVPTGRKVKIALSGDSTYSSLSTGYLMVELV